MGGNALAEFGARRFQKGEYEVLAQEILSKLRGINGYFGWVEIPSYFSKDSFGDLDVLCTNVTNEVFQEILIVFGLPPSVRNSNVLSFVYKELQVDIISTPPEDYHTSLAYFSYNDLGNLMGKLYHKFGLKYGHSGLLLPIRDGDNKFAEVVISKNVDKIFGFLGLDYGQFLAGFTELQGVFNFVISSPYFSPELFSFENMNSIARIRDRKRATYNAFLKYIEGVESVSTVSFDKDKGVYLDSIFSYFPETYGQYKSEVKRYDMLQERKAKFNGDKVLGWLKENFSEEEVVSGKEFGEFMKGLRYGEGDDFDKWVENTPEEKIREVVINTYRSWIC